MTIFNVTNYFVFDDGSLFVRSPKRKEHVDVCENYDPRSRHFYRQARSPEPRDVVVVTDGEKRGGLLLEHAISKVYMELTSIDRISLCLPYKDSCQTSKWYRESEQIDGPLGQKGFLGRLLFNNKYNREKLIKLLEETNYVPFSNHSAALKAGTDLLRNRYGSRYFEIAGHSHSVLVYVTKSCWEKWKENKQINSSLDLGISIVIIHLHDDGACGVEKGVVLKRNNATVTFSSFKDLEELRASEIGIASYGLMDVNRPVIPVPYWDAFGDGYIITVCVHLMHRASFVGVACSDLSIVNLLEAELNVDDVKDGYVFLVDRFGRALKHPLLPEVHSLTDDPTSVTIDKLEIAPEVRHILVKAVRQESGNERISGLYVESLGYPRGIDIPKAVRVRRRSLHYLWAPIYDTGLTLAVVLPLNDSSQVVSSVYSCKSQDQCTTSHFEYNEPRDHFEREFCNFFGKNVTKSKALVKFAPDCFIDVLAYVRGEIDPALVYAIFNRTQPYDSVFREDLMPSVKFLEFAEETWKSNLAAKVHEGIRYLGTEDGSFITFQGIELEQTFDHRDRSWYQAALPTPSTISITTPYCDGGMGMVCTMSKTLYNKLGHPQAVVAGDFKLQYMAAHFLDRVPYCKSQTCLLVDPMGFVVLKSDWEGRFYNGCRGEREIVGSHINFVAPDIARDLIAEKYLRRRACHEYDRDSTYYYWTLAFPAFRTFHEGPSYGIHKIADANLFLAYRTQGSNIIPCNCNPYPQGELIKCHDTCELECECPCLAGPDTIPCHNPNADVHRHHLPACKPRGPTLKTKQNYNNQTPSAQSGIRDCSEVT
ncbi:VWFA and cache domain-containing protein 1-like isoform X2 [Penaeus chinensis]|nr:VWFA and cache domain-containing protein 1-like isoform X2 [Penaeus chinensis]